MTATTATAADVVHTTDERMARLSPWKRLLVRPEFGALAGALVVWLLFAWQGGDTWLSWAGTANYLAASANFGLTAIAIALLMIGGEFDFSAGVMTGTTGMFAGLFAVHTGLNVWPAMGLSLLIALSIGFLNGFMVVKSGLPSFIVTLGTFFTLSGFNLWLTQQGHQPDERHGHRPGAGLRLRPQDVRQRHVPHRSSRIPGRSSGSSGW